MCVRVSSDCECEREYYALYVVCTCTCVSESTMCVHLCMWSTYFIYVCTYETPQTLVLVHGHGTISEVVGRSG